MGKYQSTKLFDNYSVAIRQWKAAHSHCELLHGYALKFKVWFESIEPIEEKQLDEMNWIMDYGGFKSTDAEPTPGNGLKDWMNYMWDHTLLIEKDDPYLDFFESAAMEGICSLRVMDKMGAESCAKLVYDKFNDVMSKTGGGRVRVVKVECWEADRNSSIYCESSKKRDNRSLLEREHKDFPINRKDDQEYSQDNWYNDVEDLGPNPNSLCEKE